MDQVLAETNTGYANSDIFVTVAKFCIEAATLNESDTSNLLHDFSNMKHDAKHGAKKTDAPKKFK